MTEIDVALARRLVDRQFPQWSQLPITAVEFDGWDDRSFRLGSELTVERPLVRGQRAMVHSWSGSLATAQARTGPAMTLR